MLHNCSYTPVQFHVHIKILITADRVIRAPLDAKNNNKTPGSFGQIFNTFINSPERNNFTMNTYQHISHITVHNRYESCGWVCYNWAAVRKVRAQNKKQHVSDTTLNHFGPSTAHEDGSLRSSLLVSLNVKHPSGPHCCLSPRANFSSDMLLNSDAHLISP